MAMKTRVPSNTKALQEAFPERYREFFAKHELVVSAPAHCYLAGEHSARFGAPALIQKLPIRLFVGLQPLDRPVFELVEAPAEYYFPDRQTFVRFEVEPAVRRALSDFLTSAWQRSNAGRHKERPVGFAVSYLSELPSGRGFSPSAAFGSVLSVAFYLVSGELSIEELERWNSRESKSSIFEAVFRMAWKIEQLLHTNPPDGSLSFSALINSKSPVFYFTDWRPRAEGGIGGVNEIDKINYFGRSVASLYNLSDQALSLDIALIGVGSWLKPGFRSGQDFRRAVRDRFSDLARRLSEVLGGAGSDLPRAHFLRAIEQPDGVFASQIDALSFATLRALESLRPILEGEASPEAIREFISPLRMYQNALRWFELDSPELIEIRQHLNLEARRKGLYGLVANKLSGAGRKSDLLVVSPRGSFREEIVEAVSLFRRRLNGQASLDYASWLDGTTDGQAVHIEQWLERGLISPHIAGKTYRMLRLMEDGRLERSLVVQDALPELLRQARLTFVEEGEKIYIAGRALTSREIHSAKATLRLFQRLMIQPGTPVESRELNLKPYSDDRTELQSKLISPLKKIVNQRLKSQLPLLVSGGLAEYTVRLDPGLELVLIERNHNPSQ